MTFSNDVKKTSDRRKFVRLKSIFPVEFAIAQVGKPVDLYDKWQQGYTCNLSKRGVCLETVHMDKKTIEHLCQDNACLHLRITMPLHKDPIEVLAQMVWAKKVKTQKNEKFYIGLKFVSICQRDLRRIMAQARWARYSSKTAIIILLFVFAAFVFSNIYHYGLRVQNEKLIDHYVTMQQRRTNSQEILEDVSKEKTKVYYQMNEYQKEIDNAGFMIDELTKTLTESKRLSKKKAAMKEQQIQELKQEIQKLKKAQIPYEDEYESMIKMENKLEDSLAILEDEAAHLQKNIVNNMYKWLKSHQSSSTGLVLSFEGNVGVIQDWAFTYDQALAANVFLLFDNYKSARKILNFYLRQQKGTFKGFSNAYYYDSGDVSEYTIHCGPNIWLGIAAMKYIFLSEDRYYLALAKTIADWLISIQDLDPAGGLKGGPKFNWYSTEHNLDAYAFFTMLYLFTNEEKYDLARKKTLSWLETYAMIPHSKDYKSPPVNRGRGDSTIATDTFAWAIAAIGPRQLEKIDMDPEDILNFAEDHCSVTVNFKRPSGLELEVKGFDFAKATHMPRGGMISPEWTSQMIVSYQMLSEYFYQNSNYIKAKYYKKKADMYLRELSKLIISSPSPKGQGQGCLPYATLENADTGHGWNTPFGQRTCSVAGTAYMIMAIKQYNPLMFN